MSHEKSTVVSWTSSYEGTSSTLMVIVTADRSEFAETEIQLTVD